MAAQLQETTVAPAVVAKAGEILAWHRMQLPQGEGRAAEAHGRAGVVWQSLKKFRALRRDEGGTSSHGVQVAQVVDESDDDESEAVLVVAELAEYDVMV